MSDQPRTVKLTRAVEDGGRETFGFSVSGGAGTKLPVVVWEVTPGLPAALSASVSTLLLLPSHFGTVTLVVFAVKYISKYTVKDSFVIVFHSICANVTL